jgi:hypothetical protein
MADMESLKSNTQRDKDIFDYWNLEYMRVIIPGFS